MGSSQSKRSVPVIPAHIKQLQGEHVQFLYKPDECVERAGYHSYSTVHGEHTERYHMEDCTSAFFQILHLVDCDKKWDFALSGKSSLGIAETDAHRQSVDVCGTLVDLQIAQTDHVHKGWIWDTPYSLYHFTLRLTPDSSECTKTYQWTINQAPFYHTDDFCVYEISRRDLTDDDADWDLDYLDYD